MPNYTEASGGGKVAYLTPGDLVEELQGDAIQLERGTSHVALTKEAGEMLEELTGYQKAAYVEAWRDE